MLMITQRWVSPLVVCKLKFGVFRVLYGPALKYYIKHIFKNTHASEVVNHFNK